MAVKLRNNPKSAWKALMELASYAYKVAYIRMRVIRRKESIAMKN